MTLGYPPTIYPELPVWVHFSYVTFIFVWWFSLLLSFPFQDYVCLGHIFDMVPDALVSILHMACCFHWLFHMALFCGCGKFRVIKHIVYVSGCHHSDRDVISRMLCAQLLGDLEVVIFIRKTLLEPNPCLFFRGRFPPFFSVINIKALLQDHMVRLLDELCLRVRSISIVHVLDAVVDTFEVLVNW